MKQIKLILISLLILYSLAIVFNVHNQNNMSTTLFLSQIEVLAAGESSKEPICTARKACDMNGSFVECKGWQSCDVGFVSVTCDGKKHTC